MFTNFSINSYAQIKGNIVIINYLLYDKSLYCIRTVTISLTARTQNEQNVVVRKNKQEAEALFWDASINRKNQGWDNVESFYSNSSFKFIYPFYMNKKLVCIKTNPYDQPTVKCIAPKDGFDVNMDYFLYDVDNEGFLELENKYGERVGCLPDCFEPNLISADIVRKY